MYCSAPYDNIVWTFSPTVVEVGFVDTLVEVNETDGQATLNVSITHPQPDTHLRFQITFILSVASTEGSASMEKISQFFMFLIVLLYM